MKDNRRGWAWPWTDATSLSDLWDAVGFQTDEKILLVDVGARWGKNPPWDRLSNAHVEYIGFEPDPTECARLMSQRTSSNTEYLPVGLSDSEGNAVLHITREPGCSSILHPNEDLLGKYWLSERWEVESRMAIRTVPLSRILEERRTSADVVKIDVQGAALQVLRGAGTHLDAVSLLEVEVEFCEMYRGESLFSEVDVYLRARGFELLDLNKHYARRKAAKAISSSRGQVMFADALYVRTAEDLFKKEVAPGERTRRLRSMILALMLYGHFDIALEFASHRLSTLSTENQSALRDWCERRASISQWRMALCDNRLIEGVGLLLALIGNAMRMRSRALGWGSDHNAVDGRYKYLARHPALRILGR